MCRSRDSRAPPALAIRHIPAGGMFIAANPIYGIQDPAVHRRGPDASRMPHVGVLHKCSAFGHRIKARLDDRPHSLACMLRSGSEENTTEAGPPNSRARITPICAASPLTTAARGNLRLSHRHISRSCSMSINSCAPIPLSISAWVILPVPAPSSTTGPSPRLASMLARAIARASGFALGMIPPIRYGLDAQRQMKNASPPHPVSALPIRILTSSKLPSRRPSTPVGRPQCAANRPP